MNSKHYIRNQVKEALESLTDEQYIQASQQIAEHLIASSDWKASDVVALTISRGREVNTVQIIQLAWEQGKRVAVPRADFIEKTMTFYEIKNFAELEEGDYGLREPVPDVCPVVSFDELDLIIVPGLAFDKDGGRLGFGGGFYDRFLPKVRVKTIALAFSCQLVPLVPTEEHDQKVDDIISPTGFVR